MIIKDIECMFEISYHYIITVKFYITTKIYLNETLSAMIISLSFIDS